MKKLYIVGNWKSNKSLAEAKVFLEFFKKNAQSFSSDEREIVVCPPFTLLSEMREIINENNLPIKLGVQDVSPFPDGAYTGAISAKQAAEIVTYAIIGHSERRKYFKETDDDVLAKLKQALENNLTPVLCISDINQMDSYLSNDTLIRDNAEKIIFVYEPPSAISGGGAFHAEDPETANKNAAEISTKIGKKVITLYGGSVNPENASLFFNQDSIDGGLPGQASLDAEKFMQIIKNS